MGSVIVWAGTKVDDIYFVDYYGFDFISSIIIAWGAAIIAFGFIGALGTWKANKCLLGFVSINLVRYFRFHSGRASCGLWSYSLSGQRYGK
jgi:hypothetical protein